MKDLDSSQIAVQQHSRIIRIEIWEKCELRITPWRDNILSSKPKNLECISPHFLSNDKIRKFFSGTKTGMNSHNLTIWNSWDNRNVEKKTSLKDSSKLFNSSLKFIWLFLSYIWSQALAQTTTILDITNSGGTVIAPLQINYAGWNGISRQYDNNTTNIMFAHCGSYSTPNFRFFNHKKESVASRYSTQASSSGQSSILTADFFAIGTADRSVIRAQFSMLGGYIGFTSTMDLVQSITAYIHGCLAAESTAFVYWGCYSTTNPIFYRMNYLYITDPLAAGPLISEWSNNHIIFEYDESHILSSGDSQYFVGFIDKTALFWAKRSYAVLYMRYGVLDNLNNTNFYGFGGTTTIVKAKLDSEFKSVYINQESKSSLYTLSSIINCGNLGFLIVLVTNANSIQVIRKADFSREYFTNRQTGTVRWTICHIGGYMISDTEYFFASYYGSTIDFYRIKDNWLQSEYNYWLKCPEDMILSSLKLYNYCTTRTSIEKGYGYDQATNSIKPCDIGWLDWTNNYEFWVLCDRPGLAYYRNPQNGKCYKQFNIPRKVGLVNTGTELLVACTVPNWGRWTLLYTQWLECDTGYGFNENTGNWNLLDTTNYFGRDPFNKFMLRPCKNLYCLDCSEDYYECESWIPGYRKSVYDKECYPETGTALLGQNPSDPKILTFCSNKLCKFWSQRYDQCEDCMAGYLLNATDYTWVIDTTKVAGYGLEAPTNVRLRKWVDTNWVDCYATHIVWLEWSKNYKLTGSVWDLSPYSINITFMNNTQINQNISTSILVKVSSNSFDTDPDLTLRHLSEYIRENKEAFAPVFYMPNGELETSDTNYNVQYIQPVLLLNFRDRLYLKKSSTIYQMVFNLPSTVFTKEDRAYEILAKKDTFDYENFYSLSQIKEAQSRGEVTSVFIGSWAPNKGASAAVNIIAGVDPTGILT